MFTNDKPINDKPIEHNGHYFTEFKADRADLKGGVQVVKSRDITLEQFISDVSEFVAWHRSDIWERLNGFSGYDCIRYIITEKE